MPALFEFYKAMAMFGPQYIAIDCGANGGRFTEEMVRTGATKASTVSPVSKQLREASFDVEIHGNYVFGTNKRFWNDL